MCSDVLTVTLCLDSFFEIVFSNAHVALTRHDDEMDVLVQYFAFSHGKRPYYSVVASFLSLL
jgi:hypothetical protein